VLSLLVVVLGGLVGIAGWVGYLRPSSEAAAEPPRSGAAPVWAEYRQRLTETRTANVFFALSEAVQRPGQSELVRNFAMHIVISGGPMDGPIFPGSQLVAVSGREAITNNASIRNPRNDPLPPGMELYTCNLRIEPRGTLTWGDVAESDDVVVTIDYRAES
jgi:hypothetical protein